MAKDIEASGPEAGAFSAKDYTDPPPAPLIDAEELTKWSLYRAAIAEFIATLLFLYITVATVIGYKHQTDAAASGPDAACGGVGILGIAWAFGGMIFILVYCTAGISGGHINPAVTFGLFLARKVSLVRALLYIVAQCLGAICGVGLVKGFQSAYFVRYGGGANELSDGYSKGTGLAAEIIGTFVLVYTVFSATDPKRNARDSHVPVLAPLPIGFAVFMVHLATIPITGTGINPARSLGAAVIYNKDKAWDDQGSLINMAGPKRGIDMMDFTLIEYDMRVKTGAEEKDDLQLIDGASFIGPAGIWNQPFTVHIPGDYGAVDITLSRLHSAVEATLEVLVSEVQISFDLSLSCLSSELNKGIWLFNGTIAESCSLKRSVVAVLKESSIDLKIKIDALSSSSEQHCCSFYAKTHGHDTQEIKSAFAFISVKVTWSTLPDGLCR
ncbi:hypothetical protein PVAP13_1NG338357 [Panicum virgatum]|uniref:Uncharacterized protein n=1 Tax=Panicum virgatum TaxID=38727 RepID=A0A8T0XAL5_PANVG|nr:hypothetical protein PVAP13_1NG338357 [Panicum virgatum]